MKRSRLSLFLAVSTFGAVLFGCSDDDGNVIVSSAGSPQIALVWASYGVL